MHSGDWERRHAMPRDKSSRPTLARALLAEVAGTFFITFVIVGSEVVPGVTGGDPTGASRALAAGLVVVGAIYAFGPSSGAHINPAVTLAFALRRAFSWARVPMYWIAQIVGATLAALALSAAFPGTIGRGENHPKHGATGAFVVELVFGMFLYSIILATTRHKGRLGPNSALPVGGVVIAAGLVAGPISGAALNPARSIGPSLVTGRFDDLVLYVVTPFLAAALAVGLIGLLLPARGDKEREAAEGDAEAESSDENSTDGGDDQEDQDDEDKAPEGED